MRFKSSKLWRMARREWKHYRYLARKWDWMERVLPDYIAIGAMKCGTTSINRYLKPHPQVIPALKKEPRYFDNFSHHHELGEEWYRANFPTRTYMQRRARKSGQRVITGEATPYYIFHPQAPEWVADLVPDAKLIVLLRNPVSRAYSHYQHLVKEQHERASFEDRINQILELPEGLAARMAVEGMEEGKDGWLERYGAAYPDVDHPHCLAYLAWGQYADYLEPWLARFPREQFLFIKSETFFKDIRCVMKEVQMFLEVEQMDIGKYPYYPRNYTKLDTVMRDRLQAYFEPHNRRLYELLGRDFGWS